MLYDPIRRSLVTAKPEEKVRQKFIQIMIGELGFPKGLLAVEKEVASLSPLSTVDPHRRIDILVLAPGKEGLQPLLLVECKAESIDEAALSQVLGYNRAIGAPFICLTNGILTKTFWKQKNEMVSISFLPSFSQLMRCKQKNTLFIEADKLFNFS